MKSAPAESAAWNDSSLWTLFPEGGGVSRAVFLLVLLGFLVLPMGTSPFTIAEVLILAIWLFSGECWKNRKKYLRATCLWPVMLIIALKGVGLIYSPDPQGLGMKFAEKAHYWLLPFALAGLGLHVRAQKTIIYAFLAGLSINACVAFLQFGGVVPLRKSLGSYGYVGLHGGYNTLGMLLVLGILIGAFLWKQAGTKKTKHLLSIMIIACFLHLIILRSRGAYFCFILFLPIIIYNLLYTKSLLKTAGIFLLILSLSFLSPVVQQRVGETYDEIQARFNAGGDIGWGKEYSENLDRIYMWRWAIELFLDHPIVGVGTGGLYKATLAAGGSVGIPHPHNNLLHMAVSYGLFGVAGFIWVFGVLLYNGWKYRSEPLGLFTLCSGFLLLLNGMTETNLLDAGGAFLLAASIGIQAGLMLSRSEELSV